MRIHLLAEAAPNPVLTAVMTELGRTHEVAVFDAGTVQGLGRDGAVQRRFGRRGRVHDQAAGPLRRPCDLPGTW